MTPNEYIKAMARILTRHEDLTDRQALDVLYELALRIYALLLRELPAERFARLLAWRRIRPEILLQLIAANDRLAPIVWNAVVAAELQLQEPNATYLGISPMAPRAVTDILDATHVLGTPLSRLFVPSAANGVPPFAAQLMRLIERTVLGAFMRDEPTPQIARSIIEVRTIAGRNVPLLRKGTVTNAWRERFRAITAASLWGLVRPTTERYVAAASEPNTSTAPAIEWLWNAILDPATCPVCRPLHHTTAPSPWSFTHGPPPLHPNCRCVVIPQRI